MENTTISFNKIGIVSEILATGQENNSHFF